MPLLNRVCFQVNLRDGLRCRVCGRAPQSPETYHRGFEYHHVTPQSAGGADETLNVILLCHDCHTRHHQKRLPLPLLGALTPPETIRCVHCNTLLDIAAVEMNCGWYRCAQCGHRTHLFTHCGLSSRPNKTS
jgi:hypothetical protein